MLNSALGGTLTREKETDPYQAALGENLIKFPGGKSFLEDSNTEGDAYKEAKGRATNLLERLAHILLMNPPTSMLVSGHTDSSQAQGIRNIQLSRERAIFVKNELVRHGINIERIKISACGAGLPNRKARKVPDDHRRVELEIQYTPHESSTQKKQAIMEEEKPCPRAKD